MTLVLICGKKMKGKQGKVESASHTVKLPLALITKTGLRVCVTIYKMNMLFGPSAVVLHTRYFVFIQINRCITLVQIHPPRKEDRIASVTEYKKDKQNKQIRKYQTKEVRLFPQSEGKSGVRSRRRLEVIVSVERRRLMIRPEYSRRILNLSLPIVTWIRQLFSEGWICCCFSPAPGLVRLTILNRIFRSDDMGEEKKEDRGDMYVVYSTQLIDGFQILRPSIYLHLRQHA
ncbi:hypothetical protein EAF04_005511 [Stromatinia cepivora]|nr:hypothetical protein EAF04_005511 [Stromatinia cepivora]